MGVEPLIIYGFSVRFSSFGRPDPIDTLIEPDNFSTMMIAAEPGK
jgi:hypothetical protein